MEISRDNRSFIEIGRKTEEKGENYEDNGWNPCGSTHTHTHTNVLVNNKKEYKKFQNSITMLVSKLDTG